MSPLLRLTLPPRETYNRATMRHASLSTIEQAQLAASELLRGASAELRARVNAQWKRKTLRAGETLMTAQQPGNALYFILNGTVKIHVEQVDGGDVFIDIAGAGDVVGEMSIIDHATRSASATAMEETHALWMERAALEQLLNTTPLLAQNIARILSQRLRHATARIQVMAKRDTFGRVAFQLLFLMDKYGKPNATGILIPIRLTQADLADLVGATRERVNRVMVDLRRENILQTDSANHITILDANTLREYAKR